MSWSAYVDESEPDPGAYVLAAALIPAELIEEVRSAVTALRLRGQRKLHWRAENDQRRKLLTAAIAELEVLYVVVVRVERTESSERRRRLCLRRLQSRRSARRSEWHIRQARSSRCCGYRTW